MSTSVLAIGALRQRHSISGTVILMKEPMIPQPQPCAAYKGGGGGGGGGKCFTILIILPLLCAQVG